MTYCAVKGCHNSSHNHQKHLKITFHGFPSDPIIAARWIEKVRLNRKEICWKPTKYTKICSVHFDEKEKYITKGGLCKLHQGAVPTKGLHIFCTEEIPNSNQVCNDVQLIPHQLDQPQQGESSVEAIENENFDTPTTSAYRQQQIINDNETQASNETISQKSDMGSDSIIDTLRKSALRNQLNKQISLQRKHIKKIKILHQKARRLQKINITLQKILLNLRKKSFVDNDVLNILS